MSNGTRRPLPVGPAGDQDRREDARTAPDKPWGGALAREVSFRENEMVAPALASPVVESLKNVHSSFGEGLRLLGATVHDLREEKGVRCLGLTSAIPGDGKSTVSFGLAVALARDPGRRILLIEADVRRPSLSSTLGLPPSPGLAEWLNGTLEDVPLRVLQRVGLFLLVAGQVPLERPEILRSKRMDALLRAVRGRFDSVIVDMAPVLPVADAVLMQDLVDGFLLVVRSRQTPRNAIRDAVGRLRADRILGIIVNDHREYRDSYYGYAYRRYGMNDSSDESMAGKRRESRGRRS